MGDYLRLLLFCDPLQRNSAAIERAKALTTTSGAQLYMVILDALPVGLGILDSTLQTQVREATQQRQKYWLETCSTELRKQGIEVRTEAIWTDDLLGEALRLVQLHNIDLAIKDTQYEPALRRVFMTPLDWQLLRQCPAPLHLVSTAEHSLPRRIVAALDLSQEDAHIDALNDRIVESAQQLAQQCNAELHLLQAYDLSASFLTYAAGPVSWSPEIAEQVSGRSHQRMNHISERFGIKSSNQHSIKGPANKVITKFIAEQHMDVVVMGTRYHSGLTKIIGSTAEQVLYRVNSSILALRP